MEAGRPLKIMGGLLLSGILVAVMAALGTGKVQTTDAVNESCIRCHVEQFEIGLRQAYAHLPFYERNCTACHLAAGEEAATLAWGETETLTGSLVDQAGQWQKRQIYRGESRVFEQFFSLDDLRDGVAYRFRLSVGEEPDRALATSSWLGLDLSELEPVEVPGEIELSEDSLIRDYVPLLRMTRLSSGSVLLVWDTNQPLFGWVELERLGDSVAQQGTLAATDSASDLDSGEHPRLRLADDLAIEACHDCHSPAELGTSHPVRLYGRGEVQIPADLPTVDGMLTCVTCHDPHGSEGKMLVRTVIKTKLCVTCHTRFKNSSPSTMFD